MLSFAHTMGEFGVVLMVGGNIPGETRTISIALFDKVQTFEEGAADSMALFMLLFSLVLLILRLFLAITLPVMVPVVIMTVITG